MDSDKAEAHKINKDNKPNNSEEIKGESNNYETIVDRLTPKIKAIIEETLNSGNQVKKTEKEKPDDYVIKFAERLKADMGSDYDDTFDKMPIKQRIDNMQMFLKAKEKYGNNKTIPEAPEQNTRVEARLPNGTPKKETMLLGHGINYRKIARDNWGN